MTREEREWRERRKYPYNGMPAVPAMKEKPSEPND